MWFSGHRDIQVDDGVRHRAVTTLRHWHVPARAHFSLISVFFRRLYGDVRSRRDLSLWQYRSLSRGDVFAWHWRGGIWRYMYIGWLRPQTLTRGRANTDGLAANTLVRVWGRSPHDSSQHTTDIWLLNHAQFCVFSQSAWAAGKAWETA